MEGMGVAVGVSTGASAKGRPGGGRGGGALLKGSSLGQREFV